MKIVNQIQVSPSTWYYEIVHSDFPRLVFRVYYNEGKIVFVAQDIVNVKKQTTRVTNAHGIIVKNCPSRIKLPLPNKNQEVIVIDIGECYDLISGLKLAMSTENKIQDLVSDIEVKIVNIHTPVPVEEPVKQSLWSRIKEWFKKLFHRN